MIAAAQKLYKDHGNASFALSSEPLAVTDYSVASGIFNVRFNHSDTDWEQYLEKTLDSLNAYSGKGFAFNCLTSYSDADRMRPDLYYADPCRLFDLCKRRYSRHVSLLHDYGLYEFTILVKK